MNKYKKWHEAIISNRQLNPLIDGYIEKHHIIPKSLGGTNNSENFVSLNAKEHFVCHYLLTKIYIVGTVEWYKMQHAFMFIAASSNGKRYFNSRLYEACRKNFSKCMHFAQSGNKNSQFGKIWITNLSLGKNQIININELTHWLALGWTKGRIYNFTNFSNYARKKFNIPKEEEFNSDKKQIAAKEKAETLYKCYKESTCKSIGEFVRAGFYNQSKVSLTKLWKKYIPEYSLYARRGKSFKVS